MNDFEQCRQPSYLAAVVGNSEASQGSSCSCRPFSVPVHSATQDAGKELLISVLHDASMTDKNSHQWNKHSASLKYQTQMRSSQCKTSVDVAAAKLHTRSFSDLAQWLQNGEEDVTVVNYIDRRVVESVLKCRQLGKQCPQKKSNNSQPTCDRQSYFTNTGRPSVLNSGSHETGRCQPDVTDDLYKEFGGKLETEVDGDSGFSGDRNSASSTSSGLSVESSLTSLSSVTDLWSGNQSSSTSENTVPLVDQSTVQRDASVSHIPGPVPSSIASLSSVSVSSMSQVASDVHGNRSLSEQLYGTLPIQNTHEQYSGSCHLSNMSSFHCQEPPQSASNSGWLTLFL